MSTRPRTADAAGGARRPLALTLLGTGTVGRAVLAQLAARTDAPRLVAVVNSRRALLRPEGIDPARALAELDDAPARGPVDVRALCPAANGTVPVLVDATPAAELAADHPRWLGAGVHVVSANKAALGGALSDWRSLQDAARSGGTRYGDAATVGAGLPVLATLRRLRAAGDRVLAIEGVCSGTLSFLFNRFDGQRPFSAVLEEARRRGLTEPDPRLDLGGGDVARKLLILARAAGFPLEAADVAVDDLVPAALRALPLEAFLARASELDAALEAQRAAAAANGRVLRHLARLDASGRAAVRLQAVRADHPAARLEGADNLFAITTARYRERPLVIQGPGAGPEVTAQALLADVAEIAAAAGAD